MSLVTVDGMSVEVSGPERGLPVVFGHSLLFNRRMFAAQVAELSRDYRCINVDFRGHGQSAPPPRGFAITDQADDFRKVLDQLGIEKAAFVGLSMGAMAAMHFAVAHPGRALGLVLMNTSAGAEPTPVRAKEMALAVMARAFGIRPFIVKQVAPLMFGTSYRAEHPEAVGPWFAEMKSLDRAGLYRAIVMVLSRPPVGPKLAGVRVPTLVIAGDEDVAAPPAMGRAIAETIPGAELRLLPRCGHISTVEQPEVTTKLLRVFLDRLAQGAVSAA